MLSRASFAKFALPVLCAAAGLSLTFALKRREAPARCNSSFYAQGAYCCPSGQTLIDDACRGTVSACAAGRTLTADGCDLPAPRVLVRGGKVAAPPNDWEQADRDEGAPLVNIEQASDFYLDSSEVTVGAWQRCTARGACAALPDGNRFGDQLPIVNVSAPAAAQYCAAQGGRLPHSNEWLLASAGPLGTRYPWGQTGLVCRRAVYGLVTGPCASGAQHADVIASRPDGVSPNGVFDLSGNVAEWVEEADGRLSARGGSFRSSVAGELKTWSKRETAAPADDIGFRCVYDPKN